MAVYVINGASRGIGVELCRQFNALGNEVIAVCRQVSTELEQLGIRVISGVDVADSHATLRLQDQLTNVAKIDVLINVAGIWRNETLDDMNFDTILEQFKINTLGPMRMTMALLDKLLPGAKVVMLTSRMGSIADNSSGGRYGYRISKAALNAASKSFAIDLEKHDIAVAILHPGRVATAMTDNEGISVAESCVNLMSRIEILNLENSGTFWHANGEVLPW